jgi:hypothetical protein
VDDDGLSAATARGLPERRTSVAARYEESGQPGTSRNQSTLIIANETTTTFAIVIAAGAVKFFSDFPLELG